MVWSPNPSNLQYYSQGMSSPQGMMGIPEGSRRYGISPIESGDPLPPPELRKQIGTIDPYAKDYLQQKQTMIDKYYGRSPSAPQGPSTTAPKSFQDLPMYNLVMGQGAQQSWNSNPLNSMLRNPNLPMFGFMAGTPYRLQYGNNFSQDPAERFKNDPGLQMAINEGTRGLRNAYASKGLGASGAAAAGLTDYMYKNYTDYTQGQQDLYQREWQKLADLQGNRVAGYINQQNLLSNIYGRYQDQLGNLAGTGMNISNQMGNMGNQMGSGIGSLFGQWNIGAGQQLGNWGMGAGGNIAELLANAGIFDANIWAALGAGMSNNMMQGSLLGAQLANAQNASNAQSLSSMFQGMGAFRGLQ